MTLEVISKKPTECYKDGCSKEGEHTVTFVEPDETRAYCLSHAIQQYRRTDKAVKIEEADDDD